MIHPPTLATLEVALQNLTCAAHVKEAEAILLLWQEQSPSLYACLLLCLTLVPNVRIAAILALKAVIQQHWKDKSRNNRSRIYLDEATKARIRNVLLGMVATGENALVLDVSVHEQYKVEYHANSVVSDRIVQSSLVGVIVQMACLDLPKQFLELLPTLVHHTTLLSNGGDCNMLQRRNASLALEAVLRMLSEKRLLRDKQFLASTAMTYCSALGHSVIPFIRSNSSTDQVLCEWCLLVTRCLHHLLHSALPAMLGAGGDCAVVVEQLLTTILDWSSEGLDSIASGQHDLVVELWETLVNVQDAHPVAFGRFLGPFLDMFYGALFLDIKDLPNCHDPVVQLEYFESQVIVPRRLTNDLTILALRFLANVAGCSSYIPDDTQNDAVVHLSEIAGTKISRKGDMVLRVADVQEAASTVWDHFFSDELVSDLAGLCMCHLMIISDESLSDWDADPEDYFHEENGRSVEHDVQSAAQSLFCALVESHRGGAALLRLLVYLRMYAAQKDAFLQECTHPGIDGSVHSPPAARLWEAIYTAVGLAATRLVDTENESFTELYRSVLGPALEASDSMVDPSSHLPILQRRAIWLLGCYISRLPQDLHVYRTLVRIVAANTSRRYDATIKLSAVSVLNSLLNNFEQSAEEAIGIAPFTFQSLYRFASECDTVEAYALSLEVVSSLLFYFVGTGQSISVEIANASALPVPILWNFAKGDRVRLRQNLIAILNAVASCIGEGGNLALESIALPVIDDALDPARRNDNSFIIDDTLSLWVIILRLTPGYSSDRGQLFRRANELVAVDFEHLRKIMLVAELYILRGGAAFLGEHATTLGLLLSATVGNVRPRGAVYVYSTIEAVLREFPVDGGKLLLQSGTISTMIQACAEHHRGDKDCETPRVIRLYLNVLARCMIVEPTLLDTTLPIAGFGYAMLLDTYFGFFQSVDSPPEPFSRQLWLLLLLSLLPSTRSSCDSRLANTAISHLETFVQIFLDNFDSQTRSSIGVGHFRLDEDDGDTIVTGHEQHRALLRSAWSRDFLSTTSATVLFKERIGFLLARPAHKERIHHMDINLRTRLEHLMGSI